ncbi:zinc finger and BTB domain-containing protein 38 isoform X1 [Tachyglossus aculeatus]|uniref:zinc finger and BTB domain-containing protein 38 isoform X1 n=1 Tax=Tachyglossus aculeatus TaxID=9261 RepID=UPI0018F676FA|nr:zinc finger and BTB domain-containing protein 38 isoform X1 [Tachyglossus aculeatus]XP_038599792.1 zinc finger and BTB domain-containing protein 38 isoform X1 [Tachyglossus aculeatus]
MTVMSHSKGLKDDCHSDTVLSVLNEQRIRGVLCDVTVVVGDTKFKAHSNVLAASSLYFKNLLWSRAVCGSGHVLEVDDLKAEVFTEILNYIYSSTVVIKRRETVTDLATAGKKLGIPFLEELTDGGGSPPGSPGPPALSCATERGTVKEEKNEKRPEEPAITNGPRITNAFSIFETENSPNVFSPLDLRASFKKASDPPRGPGLSVETGGARAGVELVSTLAEHSYAVSSGVEGFPGRPFPARGTSPPHLPREKDPEVLPAKAAKRRASTPASQLPGSGGARAKVPTPKGDPAAAHQGKAAAQVGLSVSPSPSRAGEAPAPREGADKVPPVLGPGVKATAPPGYDCSFCTAPSEDPALLRAHLRLHSPPHQSPLGCKGCGRQFTTLTRLGRHEQTCARVDHPATPPVPIAGNAGSFSDPPTDHVGPYTGPEPVLPTSRAAELSGSQGPLPEADHLVKVVEGQLLYTCSVCRRSYVTLSSLRRHANVHSWRRTYPCHYCNKVFALAEYRTRHEIWHTGERRYQCIFCLETFMTYYILKNHQKSFHAIDHRLAVNKKAAGGGLKPSLYPYKLYRLLPMKCRRAPYKSYQSSPYGDGLEEGRPHGIAPGSCLIPDPTGAKRPGPDFPGHDSIPPSGAVVPQSGSPGRDTLPTLRAPLVASWGVDLLTTAIQGDFYSSTQGSAPLVGPNLPPSVLGTTSGMPASHNGGEAPVPGVGYGQSAPSVIMHSGRVSSVIVHSNTIATMASSWPSAPRDPTGMAPREDVQPSPDPRGQAGSRPKGVKDKKKATPRSSRGGTLEELASTPGPGPSASKTASPARETSKTETYIAKPALPGTSADSSVAPLCQITVKIGNEAIVKRHILGSKLFYRKGRRAKRAPEEELRPPESEPQRAARSPAGRCRTERVEMSEMFDDVSDQDANDKPWRPYYNYKPKRKSKQLRKMRKVKWRKGGPGSRSPRSEQKASGDKVAALEKIPPEGEGEGEGEGEATPTMPKLLCELCDGDHPPPTAESQAEDQWPPASPRPYACEFCQKQFQSPSTLKMHMRCHTGEKPFCCQTCGRGFSVQGNLQKHERIHLGIKDFVCQYCHKAFTLSETLKIHERIHTGEKRYHCQFCLQGFLYLSTKRNHEQRHTAQGFACFQCPKVCKTAAALGMHQKKHSFKSPGAQEGKDSLCTESAKPLESQRFGRSEGSETSNVLQSGSANGIL